MPNLNQLIITSADYEIILNVPTATGFVPFPLLTVSSIDWNDTNENELIYGIGTVEPIGNKTNASAYKGKITMQVGEANALLSIAGYNSFIRVANATLAITSVIGGYSKVYLDVNINSDQSATKAKDKESLTGVDFTSIGLL